MLSPERNTRYFPEPLQESILVLPWYKVSVADTLSLAESPLQLAEQETVVPLKLIEGLAARAYGSTAWAEILNKNTSKRTRGRMRFFTETPPSCRMNSNLAILLI